jgi:membrane-associated phospholipid phosphatase
MHMLTGKVTRVASCWILAAMAVWTGATVACPDGLCYTPVLDRQLLDATFAAQMPWLNSAMKFVTWLGSMVVLVPAALLLTLLLMRFFPLANALRPALALGGAWLIAHAAKLAVARPRPDLHAALIEIPADASFPSAHTMQVCAFALSSALIAHRQYRAPALALALIVILTVAFSRVYLQVHFPSDVLAGLLAATGWVLGLHFLGRKSP